MPYSMMRAGKGDRFAIGTKSNQRLLFGYVFSNGNGTWSAERAGKKMSGVYASIHDAAKASYSVPTDGLRHALKNIGISVYAAWFQPV